MKIKFLIAIVGILLIAVICFLFSSNFPPKNEYSNFFEAVSVSLALFISAGALFYAKQEYHHHKESEKTALLCSYLKRYAEDPYVKKIEDYILNTAVLDKEGNIVAYNKNTKAENVPTIWEIEMFMHFFEEIQLLIDAQLMDKDLVIGLIGYYVGIFHKIPEFHQEITDYDDERYWKYYLKFVKSIPTDFYD